LICVCHIVESHYHSDYITCAKQGLEGVAAPTVILDRGTDYPSTVYRNHAPLPDAGWRSATAGMDIIWDEASANPVRIKIVALDGKRTHTTSDSLGIDPLRPASSRLPLQKIMEINPSGRLPHRALGVALKRCKALC
jgi:hypothetical protein